MCNDLRAPSEGPSSHYEPRHAPDSRRPSRRVDDGVGKQRHVTSLALPRMLRGCRACTHVIVDVVEVDANVTVSCPRPKGRHTGISRHLNTGSSRNKMARVYGGGKDTNGAASTRPATTSRPAVLKERSSKDSTLIPKVEIKAREWSCSDSSRPQVTSMSTVSEEYINECTHELPKSLL